MGCDFYVFESLIVQYKSQNEKAIQQYEFVFKKVPIYFDPHCSSDSDDVYDETEYEKALAEELRKYSKSKVLFENGAWFKKGYEIKFQDKIQVQPDKLFKVTKETRAVRRF